MRKTKKSTDKANKNTERLDKQTKLQQDVKRGKLPAVTPEVSEKQLTDQNRPIHQGAGSGLNAEIHAVDPELERQMAAKEKSNK